MVQIITTWRNVLSRGRQKSTAVEVHFQGNEMDSHWKESQFIFNWQKKN